MSIWAIGLPQGCTDTYKEFISKGIAYIGWKEEEAPTLYSVKREIRTGDLIYLKSLAKRKRQIIIKAVGIVMENHTINDNKLSVKWLSTEEVRISINAVDKYNVYNNTLYQEYSKEIQDEIISIILNVKLNFQ